MEMVMFETWVRPAIENIEYKLPELRDLFAMSALQGILPTPYGQAASNENVASSAYAVADAMLEARKKK